MMHTTLLIVFGVIAAFASICYAIEVSYILTLPKEGRAEFHHLIEECYKETHTTEEFINKFSGKDLDKRTENENCFFACYHKIVGSLNDNGVYDRLDIIKPYFSKENFDTVVNCCNAYAGVKNICEKAFNSHMCVLANRTRT